jgi:3-phenylpropionate/trans-cinnamate dioxygenase ferredoxin reductase subunit
MSPAMADRTFVIVGAGLAAAKAAETLRCDGHDGPLVVVGAEPELPYERPPLSKSYLLGRSTLDDARVHDAAFYAEHDIDLRLGTRALDLDVVAHEVALDDGTRLRYARLLLATGATPRRLPSPAADLPGVLYLRDVADADALAGALVDAPRVVVVGGGWIGCEVAAAARTLGADVTIVEPEDVPLKRVLGERMGAFFRDVHASEGVQVLTGTGVEAVEGGGRVERVWTTDGRMLHADLVVVGIGVRPATELAERAGLAVANGVTVDAHLRTSAPDVFAAGDVAHFPHPRYGAMRVEHWANALHQGPAAARSMLGAGARFERLPYFFSDQYDVGMEYSGFASGEAELIVRGDVAERRFIAFWLRGDVVDAAMNVGVWDVAEDLQRLIAEQMPVDRDALHHEAKDDNPESLAQLPLRSRAYRPH